MIPMFAEVLKDGEWHKVGKVFPSALPELEGQLTDRVYDGSNKALEDVLFRKTLREFDIFCVHDGVADDTCDEIATHRSLAKKKVRYVYAKQLMAFLVKHNVYDVGYITEWQYKRLRDGIKPVNIRKNVPKNSGVKVNKMEMDMILNNPSLRREDVKYFIRHEYNIRAFNKDCPFFFDKTVPVLVDLCNHYDQVRIVYGMKE